MTRNCFDLIEAMHCNRNVMIYIYMYIDNDLYFYFLFLYLKVSSAETAATVWRCKKLQHSHTREERHTRKSHFNRQPQRYNHSFHRWLFWKVATGFPWAISSKCKQARQPQSWRLFGTLSWRKGETRADYC